MRISWADAASWYRVGQRPADRAMTYHEAVICAESAHINTDECGSPERLLGTKLLAVPAADGKLTPDLIAERLEGRGNDHFAQPAVVAITQSTELGTCYSLAELRKLADFCHASDLRLYLDGARLANAAASLKPSKLN